MDRYHSGYPSSYPSSRYPCNNVEYQYPSNSVNYQQQVTHSTPNAVTGQSQYNQYSHNSLTNYGYYQGNNSTSPMYNNNLQNSASNNVCRYGNNATSSTVPNQQEQGYYTQQYSSPQQGQIVQENSYGPSRGCPTQENIISPIANQVSNDHEQPTTYPKVSSVINGTSVTTSESSVTHQKSTPDSFANVNASCVSMSNSNFESCQDNKPYCNNYNISNKAATPDQTSLINSNCTPTPPISQTYQQSSTER